MSHAGLGTGRATPGGLTTLGAITNSNGAGGAVYSAFDGVAVNSTDVLVAFTYIGDTELRGYVDAIDLANTLAGLKGGLTGWENGDFTYSGAVTSLDVQLVLTTLAGQGAPLGGPGSGGSAVPEPSAATVMLAAIGALGRRARRS